MAPKVLTEEVVIGFLREEYDRRIERLREEIDMVFPVDGEDKLVLSQALKLRRKKGEGAGQLYTVDQVGPWGCILSWIDGEGRHTLKVDKDTLEAEFEL